MVKWVWPLLAVGIGSASTCVASMDPYAPIAPMYETPSTEEVAIHRARKLLENLRPSEKATDAVVASTCRRTLVLSEFLDERELTRRPEDAAAALQGLDLKAKVTSPLEAFKAIRATVLGRAILKKFLPRYGTDIKVEMTSSGTIQQEAQNTALAFYDPLKKLIRIERNAEAGSVAFVLLHEIVHALDQDYTNALRKQIDLRERFDREISRLVGETAIRVAKPRDQLIQADFPPGELKRLARMKLVMDQMQDIQIFRAERFAYDASYDVWKELYGLFPDYYRGTRGLAGDRLDLKGEPVFYDDDHIVRINGLNPSFIQRYKQGRCTPFQPRMFAPSGK